MKEQIDSKMYEKILNDTQTTTVWAYEIIKYLCLKVEQVFHGKF